MKTTITSIMPSGYGHKKITIVYSNGKEYSATTSCMNLCDSYSRDIFSRKDEREYNRASKALIRIVKQANGLR